MPQCQQLRFIDAVSLPGVGRNIDAAARNVQPQILPEIDQLQRGADVVAFLKRLRIAHTVRVRLEEKHGLTPDTVWIIESLDGSQRMEPERESAQKQDKCPAKGAECLSGHRERRNFGGFGVNFVT